MRRTAAAAVSILLLACADCVIIRSKGLEGSVCLHEEQDGAPFHFDRGELAEYMLLSNAVHMTRHGVRFISKSETPQAIHGWYSVPCILRSDRHGALCVVVDDAGRVVSHILPCSDTYTPVISESNATTALVASFILEQVPEALRGCRGTAPGNTGIRHTDTSGVGMYDVTQCDLLYSEMTVMYSVEHQVLYLKQGLELSGWLYALVGTFIVVLVSCIAQDVIDLCFLEKSKRDAAPAGFGKWVAIILGTITVCGLIASDMANSSTVFVTSEDYVCFVFLVVYICVRVLVLLCMEILPQQRAQCWHSAVMHHEKAFNLLTSILLLLIMRVYMTVSTPYTLPLTVLLGMRLVSKALLLDKVRQEHPSPAGIMEWLATDCLQVVDAFLIQTVCWAGVGVNFDNQTLTNISHTVTLFLSIILGRLLCERVMVVVVTPQTTPSCMWRFDLSGASLANIKLY